MTTHEPERRKKAAAAEQPETPEGLSLDAETLKDLDQDAKQAQAIRGGANYSRVASVAF